MGEGGELVFDKLAPLLIEITGLAGAEWGVAVLRVDGGVLKNSCRLHRRR